MEKIVEIKADNYACRILLSKGANCISLTNKKYKADILREPKDFGNMENPYVYGMPILYPVNRISGGKVLFQGREYCFDINEPHINCHLHGNLHSSPFEIVDRRDDFVKCSFYREETAQCPMSFKLEISYHLSSEGMTQKTEIFNLSDHAIPNFLGFHTTFNLSFIEGANPSDVTIKVDLGEEIERNMENYLPTGRILPEDDVSRKIKNGDFYPTQRKISRHYKACGDGVMEIADQLNRVKVVYQNDKKFGWRLILNDDGFVCMEPMTCMANCQNSPFDREFAGFDFIEPNTSKTYVSKIRLEEF